jgi:type I restriction enzyme S subunit
VEFATRTLGEICDEVDGIIQTGPFGSQLHQSDYRDEGTPVVMPKDLADDRVSVESIARIGDEDVERLARHKLETGDIVYARRGDIGRRALITSREAGWMCGTGCMRISLGDTILNPRFLFYYLGQPDIVTWIYNQAVGATMPNLNTSIVRSVPVKYPPLPTQHKIAAVLSAYDDLIENNTRRIAVLEEMARLLYQEWFVRFCFPGHEDVAMVDSELGSVPEGWKQTSVSEIADVFRGRSYRSADLVEEGSLPFLNLKCVDRDGGFRHEGLKRYAGRYKETQEARPGDIIVAVTDMTQERRIVARAARVPDIGEEPFVFSMDLVKIVPKEGIPSDYLYGMLLFSRFPDEVKQYASGVNVLHLRPTSIEEFEFALPPEKLRREYAAVVSTAYKQCDVLHKKNDLLRRTRDLLLPRLVSGQVDVSNMPIAVTSHLD